MPRQGVGFMLCGLCVGRSGQRKHDMPGSSPKLPAQSLLVKAIATTAETVPHLATRCACVPSNELMIPVTMLYTMHLSQLEATFLLTLYSAVSCALSTPMLVILTDTPDLPSCDSNACLHTCVMLIYASTHKLLQDVWVCVHITKVCNYFTPCSHTAYANGQHLKLLHNPTAANSRYLGAPNKAVALQHLLLTSKHLLLSPEPVYP